LGTRCPHDAHLMNPRSKLVLLVTAALATAVGRSIVRDQPADDAAARYFKGNTHTHSLWSDGNGAPQLIARWYKERGYDFLALTDHNILMRGEKWFTVAKEGGRDQRLTKARLDELQEVSELSPVETRVVEGVESMRLWTLEQVRERFEQPNEFLLIESEEVTGGFDGRPVHINALGVDERLLPGDGDTLSAMMDDTVGLIRAHGEGRSHPTLAFVNHPNFQWAMDFEELAMLTHDRFFEVYNGHPSTNNAGDEAHPSTEDMWDRAMVRRMTELGRGGEAGLLYALATDDSHEYHEWGPMKTNPGRGWVMVRATELSEVALLEAMHAGDFYASSGVELKQIVNDGTSLSIQIEPEFGMRYKTSFIGTRINGDVVGKVGSVFSTTDQLSATYRFAGDELYVRAVVEKLTPQQTETEDWRDPFLDKAWVQPVLVKP
jgi:hypothetical protein